MTTHQPPGPLAGLRVLELADEKIQYCGKLFADLGADVLKVEVPGGDAARRIGPFWGGAPHPDRSIPFWYDNTSKRSITLNLAAADGRDLFRALVGRADVLLEAGPPGYVPGLGLGYAALRDRNPRLVMVSVTPFGQTGPWKDWKASDLVSLALGGPVASCGYDDHTIPPVRGGGGQAWHVAGHYAFVGALIAVYHRQATGRGQYVDCSIHEALSCTTEGASVYGMLEQAPVLRQTGRHATATPSPPSQFLCADGRYVAGVGWLRVDASTWDQLVAWLDQDGMAMDLTDPRYQDPAVRAAESAHIGEVLEAFCLTHTAEEVFRGGQAIGLTWGLVRSPYEVVHDPHSHERGYTVTVEHDDLGQRFSYPGAPYVFSASPWRISRRAPHVGEHNHAVYCGELGLSEVQLTQLAEAGIV
ncbi:MAG: CoA transferase [Chloroflexi bacterium]|nr:CoA transferase [Chloroflexota bacterium]